MLVHIVWPRSHSWLTWATWIASLITLWCHRCFITDEHRCDLRTLEHFFICNCYFNCFHCFLPLCKSLISDQCDQGESQETTTGGGFSLQGCLSFEVFGQKYWNIYSFYHFSCSHPLECTSHQSQPSWSIIIDMKLHYRDRFFSCIAQAYLNLT